MASVVLVTGAGHPLGERLAARLSAEDSIERIIAVDSIAPSAPLVGRAEFVRADIRHPLIGKVLEQAGVDTVVHTRCRDEGQLGTRTLLAACENVRTLTRFVAESSTAGYGATASAPAVFTERDPVDDPVETMLRAFARHRRDVTVSTLRLADIVGHHFDSPAMRQLQGPLVATVFGFDPRLQLVHVDDAVEVLTQACVQRHPGATNVAGAGVLTLAQLARRAGLLRIGGPARLVGARTADLRFGRVVDTTRLAVQFGYVPQYSTAEALASSLVFSHTRATVPALALAAVTAAERVLTR